MASKLTLFQALGSVVASFVGIQSHKNFERDAMEENMGQLIVVGILLTILIHVGLYFLVKYIVAQAGLG